MQCPSITDKLPMTIDQMAEHFAAKQKWQNSMNAGHRAYRQWRTYYSIYRSLERNHNDRALMFLLFWQNNDFDSVKYFKAARQAHRFVKS